MVYVITKTHMYRLHSGKLLKVCNIENFPYELAIVRDRRNFNITKVKGNYTDIGIELIDSNGVRVGVIYRENIKIV